MAEDLQAFVPGELTGENERVCCDVISGRAELQCQVCRYILDGPMLLGCCGHYLCARCLESIQQSRISGGRSCPFCKALSFTTLLNKGLLREVNELRVYCPNHAAGCLWEGKLNQVAGHVASKAGSEGECLYHHVKCKFPECSSCLLRKDLHNHESEVCTFRPYTCKYCLDFTANYSQVSSQHFPVCPDYPVTCPNKCGSASMPRSAVDQHLNNKCSLQEVACEYKSAGCDLVRARKDMAGHYKSADVYHNKLLVKQNASLQSKLDENQHQLERVIRQQAQQNSQFEELLRQQEERHQKQLSALEARLAGIAGEVKRNSSALDKIPGEVKAAVEAKKKLTGEITVIENSFVFETNQIKENLSGIAAEMLSLKDYNEETRKLMGTNLEVLKNDQSSMVVSLVVQEMGLTLDGLEEMRMKTSTNQRLVTSLQQNVDYVEKCITPQPPFSFTVSRFSERKFNKEAFVSPPFYTHPRGYKVCVRVDVYGMSNDLAVHCCIMKGEHDHNLAWPFMGDIYVQIQNQLGDFDHYEKIIQYAEDTGENKSGQVITGDKNYLHGFHQFISHQELALDQSRNCQYLKGDAIDFQVIKIDVKS